MRVLDKNEVNEVSGGFLGLLLYKKAFISSLFSVKKRSASVHPAPAPAPKH